MSALLFSSLCPGFIYASIGAAIFGLGVCMICTCLIIATIYIVLRPRRVMCPTCNVPMKLQSATGHQGLPALNEAEQKEVEAGALAQELYVCDSCFHHQFRAVPMLLPNASRCGQCELRTLKTQHYTVRKPSLLEHGEGLTKHHCINCNYEYSSRWVIPRNEIGGRRLRRRGFAINMNPMLEDENERPPQAPTNRPPKS